MLSPETGSSFCLKQTLGAPDATESHALFLGRPAPRGDPALPYNLSAAALPGDGGLSVAEQGQWWPRACVSLQCPHLRRAGAFLMGCVRPP